MLVPKLTLYVPKWTVPIFRMYRKWLYRYWYSMYRNRLYRKKHVPKVYVPKLSCTESDVPPSTHGVALVQFRMQVWNMLHAARWKCRTQEIAKNSPSGHHRVTFSGYIFATKAHIDNRKKNLLSSNISSTCSDNMVNFGEPTAEIGSGVCGTPTNVNRFCVLAALLHGI